MMYHLIPKPDGLPRTTWIGRKATWTAYNDRIIYGLTWWRRDFWKSSSKRLKGRLW